MITKKLKLNLLLSRLNQFFTLLAEQKLPISWHKSIYFNLYYYIYKVLHLIKIYNTLKNRKNNSLLKNKIINRTRPRDDPDFRTTRWGL